MRWAADLAGTLAAALVGWLAWPTLSALAASPVLAFVLWRLVASASFGLARGAWRVADNGLSPPLP